MSVGQWGCFTANHRNLTAFPSGRLWGVSFSTAGDCCVHTIGNKMLCFLISLFQSNSTITAHLTVYEHIQRGKHISILQVCHLSQHPLHQSARLPSTEAPCCLWIAFESEDEFSTLISVFVFCFVIHITGKSSQGAACRGNLPVSGTQSGQLLPFLSLTTATLSICSQF